MSRPKPTGEYEHAPGTCAHCDAEAAKPDELARARAYAEDGRRERAAAEVRERRALFQDHFFEWMRQTRR